MGHFFGGRPVQCQIPTFLDAKNSIPLATWYAIETSSLFVNGLCVSSKTVFSSSGGRLSLR